MRRFREFVDPDSDGSPLLGSGTPPRADRVLRSNVDALGDFADLCAVDPDGVAQLLGVSPDQVARWSPTIRSGLDRIRREGAVANAGKKVLPTG